MSNTRSIAPTSSFAFDLLSRRASADSGKNVLVSPASVSIALAMTMNGARNATESGIARTLGLAAGALAADRNVSYQNLLADLSSEALGVELSIANAIWAKEGVKFEQDFLDANKRYFNAQVSTADFGAPETVTAINDWASENTKKKISKIIGNIDPSAIMFLLNAVYFKGSWSTKFDKADTTDKPFTCGDGSVITVPTMRRSGSMRQFWGEGYQGVALPFGESGRVNLYAVLPEADQTPESVLAGFNESTFASHLQDKYPSDGTLLLPRFQLEYDVDLSETLAAMGMSDAFNSATADLSGIAAGPLFISKVKHKTFAKFDEEGGEAAAVTSVEVGIESVQVPWTLVFNRPFLAVLADDQTGTVLFAAVVNNPAA